MQARLTGIESALDALAKQVTFLPPQIRMLGNKVDGVAFSISESRYRTVLLNLLSIYDLVDQVLRMLPAAGRGVMAEHRRNYEVLATQLHQILEANGLREITADGVFDAAQHRAVQCVPCDDPAQAGRVVEVVRPGFRTEQAILRYAEVVVSQYMLNEGR
jgi:molecular chaperone GrpE (heat shock protein)